MYTSWCTRHSAQGSAHGVYYPRNHLELYFIIKETKFRVLVLLYCNRWSFVFVLCFDGVYCDYIHIVCVFDCVYYNPANGDSFGYIGQIKTSIYLNIPVCCVTLNADFGNKLSIYQVVLMSRMGRSGTLPMRILMWFPSTQLLVVRTYYN